MSFPGLSLCLLPKWRTTRIQKRWESLFRISAPWRSMPAKNRSSGIQGQLCHQFQWLQLLNRMPLGFIGYVNWCKIHTALRFAIDHAAWSLWSHLLNSSVCENNLILSRDSSILALEIRQETVLKLASLPWKAQNTVSSNFVSATCNTIHTDSRRSHLFETFLHFLKNLSLKLEVYQWQINTFRRPFFKSVVSYGFQAVVVF